MDMKIKYVLILVVPFLFFGSKVQAATYWVDSSFQELTQREVNEVGTYVSPVPASIMQAKQSNQCFSKFQTVQKRIVSFEQRHKELNTKISQVNVWRDQLIEDLNKKFVLPCLKSKETKTNSSKKETGTDSDYAMLEARVKSMELQIKDIIKALQSMGKLTQLKV